MTRASSPLSVPAEAALAYGGRGWSVFPLAPRDKTPLTSNGFKAATADPMQLIEWWTKWPTANIGLATGIDFDVLDLDGEEGRQAFLAYLAEKGASGFVHSGPVSQTGKGWHLLFQRTGEGNRANMLPKVDFRGIGGYIVAPPSLHPLGHHYRWLPGRDENAPLPPPPPWLKQLLARERENPNRVDATIRRVANPYATPGTTAERLLGTANITLTRPDILEVASQLNLYVQRSGSDWMARCPFHHGYAKAQVHEGTPAMQLDTEKNNFYCHVCRAYGDSFDLKAHRDMNGQTF